MKILSNIFISIDQLGNALAGGNPDNTISSRIGYYTEYYYLSDEVPNKWTFFKNIVNFTFYPIDGDNHCREAYYNDAGESFDGETKDFMIAIMAIFIIMSCVPIMIFLYILYAFGVVSPKKINRTNNIKIRLKSSEAKLQGALTELNSHKVVVDQELDDMLDVNQNTLEMILEKIEALLDIEQRLESFKVKGKKP